MPILRTGTPGTPSGSFESRSDREMAQEGWRVNRCCWSRGQTSELLLRSLAIFSPTHTLRAHFRRPPVGGGPVAATGSVRGPTPTLTGPTGPSHPQTAEPKTGPDGGLRQSLDLIPPLFLPSTPFSSSFFFQIVLASAHAACPGRSHGHTATLVASCTVCEPEIAIRPYTPAVCRDATWLTQW